MTTKRVHFLTWAVAVIGLGASALVQAAAGDATPTANAAAPTAPVAAACPGLLNKTFPRLQDEKPQSLCQYSGKVLLVVNTASYCGFTGQYKGLEALHAKYKDRGLVVLGFPSGDFGEQEKATNKEIAEFCANTYSVKFPMFAKSHVAGAEANPLFAELTKASGTRPKWNFYKYLVARDGRVIDAYSSMTTPDDRDLVRDVEKALAQ
ncbi:glutathione peroxidase [Aquabacterium sp.]|uniref:glutathione peroxidase n=1 Tax=Aquabacterium sp. TaxID=1872578 RepID=UPI0025BA1FA9|nr:glutathione peroxidase [Aquabacterium sp.]